MKKRLMPLLLALCLALSLLPTAALATSEEPAPASIITDASPVEEDSADTSEPTEESDPTEESEPADEPAPLSEDIPLDGAGHSHCICGKASCSSHGGVKTFTEWTDALATSQYPTKKTAKDVLPRNSGYYYLTEDVTLSDSWTPRDGVVLCLNGHKITANFNGDVIIVTQNYTLTLTNCSSDDFYDHVWITHGTGYEGHGVDNSGTFNMYRGCIYDNNTTSASAKGSGVFSRGTFNMYGGIIASNVTKGYGAGVYIDSGIFNMHGGTIAQNKVTEARGGGGVYIADGTFNMYTGATLENNEACTGGGVYVVSTGTFNMYGGTIKNNTARDGSLGGGGIYNMGTLNLSGGSITGNKAPKANANGGGGITNYYSYTTKSALTLSGNVTVTGNTTSTSTICNINLQSGSKIKLNNFTGTAGVTASNGIIATDTGSSTSTGTLSSDDDTKAITIDGKDRKLATKKSEITLIYSDTSYTFAPSSIEGYEEAPSKTFTIRNTGSLDTGALTLSLDNSSQFELSPATIANLAPNAEATFTIKPKLGLTPSSSYYKTTITITGGSDIRKTLDIYFDVVHTGGEATCTQKAVCSKCGHEYGDLDYNNHNYTAETVKPEALKSSASCTAAAVYYKSCSACGHVEKADTTPTFSSGNPLDHEWKNGHCDNCGTDCAHTGGTATCTELAECTNCGEKYGSLAKHNYTAETAKSEALKSSATCTAAAVYYKSCSACGHVEKADTTPTFSSGNPLDHEWKKGHCDNCGADDPNYTPTVSNNGVTSTIPGGAPQDIALVAVPLVGDDNTAAVALISKQLGQTAGKSHVLDIYFTQGGTKISVEGRRTVTIPIPEGWDAANTMVYYIDPENGTMQNMNGVVSKDGKTISFETDHFSYYALVQRAKATPESTATPAPTTSPKPVSKSPKTGDESAMLLWAVLLLGSGAALTVCRKKKSK